VYASIRGAKIITALRAPRPVPAKIVLEAVTTAASCRLVLRAASGVPTTCSGCEKVHQHQHDLFARMQLAADPRRNELRDIGSGARHAAGELDTLARRGA
jgi:hypothetical protein